jgi:competence protein ComEA
VPVFTLGVAARRRLALALLALVALVVAWRHAAGSQAASPAASPSLAVAPVHISRSGQAVSPRAPSLVIVDVAGAVRRPGLVRLPKGARVSDAIARAGGLTARAQREAVNLAAPVADGQQVLVPARGAATGPAASAGGGPSGPVSLSSATPEQLDALPGVGPVTAQKIIDYRTEHGGFRTVEELDAIPGIGPARIADLHDLVVP